MIWYKLFVLLLAGDFNFWIACFDSDFSLITKLFDSLTKTGNHLQVQEFYCLIGNNILIFILRETNIIRHTTSFADNLVNNIITDGTILKSNDIDNTRMWDCVLQSQPAEDLFWLDDAGLLLCLTEANVW